MLKNFYVEKLNGKFTRNFEFYPDLNVFTGRNGSGKTTILKLMWYLISGNIERILSEVKFKSVSIETTEFSLSIEENITRKKKEKFFDITYKDTDKYQETIERTLSTDEFLDEHPWLRRINWSSSALRRSLFFSTFRRLEGGFSTTTARKRIRRRSSSSMRNYITHEFEENIDRSIHSALESLTERLSIQENIFVSSVSTADITNLLLVRYAEISEIMNAEHRSLVDRIMSDVRMYSKVGGQSDSAQAKNAHKILNELAVQAEKIDENRAKLMEPFDILGDLVDKFYEASGIEVGTNLVVGKPTEAINSNMLSSGEKQFLSFMCYNAFISEVPIFIDEPELSLHVDWQRVLFPVLLEQNKSNQFIIATHSPFIYSNFPDREHNLSEDE